MRKIWILLKNDLLLPSFLNLLAINIFFIAFLFIIFGFTLNNVKDPEFQIPVIIIWVSYLINIAFLYPKVYQDDVASGRMESFLANKISAKQIFISKFCYVLIALSVMNLVLIPLACLLYEIPTITLNNIIIATIITNPILAMLINIFASVLVQVSQFLGVIILPMLLPVTILAILASFGMSFSIKILLGINLILLPLSINLSKLLIED
ncbi:heme exporter protein CcmB [Rickettsiales endosymbiont of Stachyamoeba lipophora]|uniref:heme exporter protein CcmB n=1 Tax=Rickettsiales endosymbiont of Stachyamoeba lipophora TaxID=2486578 RepID=UPI000F650951|nr:heme exporter protein CcmB [Rickettsiales endosymbiont of Stachyamoeba lipophora]AZL15163.1 hypothetical protein EF513_01125 [Rickettsiales endosymbiont of Stachyamoeba lipophora]